VCSAQLPGNEGDDEQAALVHTHVGGGGQDRSPKCLVEDVKELVAVFILGDRVLQFILDLLHFIII